MIVHKVINVNKQSVNKMQKHFNIKTNYLAHDNINVICESMLF